MYTASTLLTECIFYNTFRNSQFAPILLIIYSYSPNPCKPELKRFIEDEKVIPSLVNSPILEKMGRVENWQ
jgi:hypothetical protein